nr:immunoglobulin light chain junction region [Macaca mulatta]MOW40578.1 immunoglobulin light chain junction region [Macaca mulatta]MOW40671.1 immunoglobulin light chain junction region [Macaca mulatta]MOW40695.1 immunoglobulin light chain junction region [Macaca mulatta]MOW40700.1 immunoglobulin light chain junction region [Macaca mulatta]
CQQYNSDPYNF